MKQIDCEFVNSMKEREKRAKNLKKNIYRENDEIWCWKEEKWLSERVICWSVIWNWWQIKPEMRRSQWAGKFRISLLLIFSFPGQTVWHFTLRLIRSSKWLFGCWQIECHKIRINKFTQFLFEWCVKIECYHKVSKWMEFIFMIPWT